MALDQCFWNNVSTENPFLLLKGVCIFVWEILECCFTLTNAVPFWIQVLHSIHWVICPDLKTYYSWDWELTQLIKRIHYYVQGPQFQNWKVKNRVYWEPQIMTSTPFEKVHVTQRLKAMNVIPQCLKRYLPQVNKNKNSCLFVLESPFEPARSGSEQQNHCSASFILIVVQHLTKS